MKKTRLEYSVINSSVTLIIQVLTLLLKFLVQTIFIRTLGIDYLGINGLFTNILSLLSFAELGVGNAIVFSLYKPLAENNRDKISALMSVFRKSYNAIGFTIGILGIILLPFLHLFIKGNPVPNIKLLFVLFLLNSVFSYFFAYKRSLLIADQRGYVSSINQFIFSSIQYVVQIIVLMVLKQYALFLIIQIICTVASNFFIVRKVNSDYPFLNKKRNKKIEKKDKSILIKNIIGMIGSKIGGIAVYSTDNLIISAFLGIKWVGIYSNYSLIISSITNILNQVTNSITSSVGNLTTFENHKKEEDVFYKHFFINFFLAFFCANMLVNVLNPFILVWIGNKYLLSKLTVILIVLNFFIDQLRQTPLTFISSFGLFWQTKWKSILEALLNLVLSLFFLMVLHLGIDGIMLGTLSSNVLINLWWEPYLVYKYGLHRSQLVYYVKYFKYVLFTFGVVFITSNTLFFVPYTGIWHLVLIVMYIAFVSLFTFFFCFYRTNEFKYFLEIFSTLINKFLRRK